ncbi:MAG: PA14 domain-containing protein [Terracidiphilus sp.]
MIKTDRIPALGMALLVLSLCSNSAAPFQLPPPPSTTPQSESAPYLLRLTTREVLVDVVATDRRDHPIRDLSVREFEIVELKEHGNKTPVGIASFRPVDATLDHSDVVPRSGGFRVSLGGDCAARSTFHYAISFHPDEVGWQGGYHEIEVRTTRPGVKLAYRPRYYVGAREAPERLPTLAEAAAALQAAACYRADLPPSIGLAVRPVATGLNDVVRFFVTVDADSLAFISVSTNNRRVQLDYGACTFDRNGRLLRYFNSAADRMLTSQEYAQAVVHGFPNLLEFPRMKDGAMMRVVARDRTTGNIGNVDLVLTSDFALQSQAISTADEQSVEKIALQQMDLRAEIYGRYSAEPYIRPPYGPLGSFGSVVPRPPDFCGDVYDLPKETMRLPNFWNLGSIGSLHATLLDVPHQNFTNTGGIPGITSGTAWLGIDYHAIFWVKNPGTYQFRLLVDDGAKLFIDDQKVIDMDGVNSGRMASGQIKLSQGEHSMHVPYIQGPPTDVGLVLAVKSPGEHGFQIFDLRTFGAPQDNSETSVPK